MPSTEYKDIPTVTYDDLNGGIELNKMSNENSNMEKTNLNATDVEKSLHPSDGKDQKELRVYYAGDANPYRRTKMEKYLIALSILLFTACVAFIVIAFTREHRKPGK